MLHTALWQSVTFVDRVCSIVRPQLEPCNHNSLTTIITVPAVARIKMAALEGFKPQILLQNLL